MLASILFGTAVEGCALSAGFVFYSLLKEFSERVTGTFKTLHGLHLLARGAVSQDAPGPGQADRL